MMFLKENRAMTMRTAWAVLAALALVVPPSAQAQEAEGTVTVVGTVFDSTEMKRLEGARVAVIGTNAFGDTDAQGRFELENVPAGTHWISFFHPRLQTLGVSPPSRQVTFQRGSTTEVTLAVPGEATLLKGWCLAEQAGPDAAALAGMVTDSLTGVPMSRAIVTVTPTGLAAFGGETVEVRADESGYYRICEVPGGQEVKVQAHFGNSSGRSLTVELEPGEARMQDLILLMSAEGTLSGQVVDYVSGQPVPGAEVSVLGTDAQTLTDSLGNFYFELPPGRHLVTTDHLAYEQRTDSITILSQETVGIEVRMASEAIEVEGLVVTARSRFGQNTLVTAKRRDVITRDEIEPMLTRVQHAGDLLRNMNAPGLLVREIYVEDNATGIRVPGLCVEVTRRTGGNEQCHSAAVFLNEVRVPYPDQILRDLDPQIIDRIEILQPVDAQFRFGTVAGDGAVLIYTR